MLDVARIACEQAGLKLLSEPTLLRHGTNVVYRIDTENGPLLCRVSPASSSVTLVQEQSNLANWLNQRGYPTPRALGMEVIHVDDNAVVLWEWLQADDMDKPVDFLQLGKLVRDFHDITTEYDTIMVPSWEPLGATGIDFNNLLTFWTGHPEIFGTAENEILQQWRATLEEAVGNIHGPLGQGLIHGDAHFKNVIISGGVMHLIDYDRIAQGPKEWDLCQVIMANRFYGLPNSDVDDFMAGYGWDIRSLPGFESLLLLRALYSTAWMLTLPPIREVQDEIINRMNFWRSPSDDARWTTPDID